MNPTILLMHKRELEVPPIVRDMSAAVKESTCEETGMHPNEVSLSFDAIKRTRIHLCCRVDATTHVSLLTNRVFSSSVDLRQ